MAATRDRHRPLQIQDDVMPAERDEDRLAGHLHKVQHPQLLRPLRQRRVDVLKPVGRAVGLRDGEVGDGAALGDIDALDRLLPPLGHRVRQRFLFEQRDVQRHLHLQLLDAEADGNHLNSAPGLTANLGGSYWLTPAWNVDLAANYVAEYYGDFLNSKTGKAGDYLLANLSTSYEQGSWQLAAFINNLADEEALLYQTPPNPRMPNGTAQIADPRTIGASVTYSF